MFKPLVRYAVAAAVAASVAAVSGAPAVAQVYYAHRAPFDPFFSPYDESYGTSPSFEIAPGPYGAPGVRVVEHCQYPDGWNVTDFSRDLNGIPNGNDHLCPDIPVGGHVRARY